MSKEKLNVNAAKAISDFQEAAREFELKEKIYRILYRGKGLEFEGYRDYAPDDDATNIDWKATMRSGRTIVRRYKEERDLDIVFVVDVSDNMLFGSVDKLKCEHAAEIIAALSHLIINSNDRVGIVLFSDKIIEYIAPKGGRNQLYLIIDKLSDPENYGGRSNLRGAFKFVIEYLSREIEAVILVSDFIRLKQDLQRDLSLMPRKFETTAIMVKDPLDLSLPNVDRELVLEDPITKQQLIVNPKIAGKMYERYAKEQETKAMEIFRKSNVDVLKIVTDNYFVFPLANFLKERVEKRGLAV